MKFKKRKLTGGDEARREKSGPRENFKTGQKKTKNTKKRQPQNFTQKQHNFS